MTPDPDYTTDTAKHPFIPSNEDSALCEVCGEARNWHPPPLTDERLAELRRSNVGDIRQLLAHIDWFKAEVERLKAVSEQKTQDHILNLQAVQADRDKELHKSLFAEVERLKGERTVGAIDTKIEMLTERIQRGNDAVAAAATVAKDKGVEIAGRRNADDYGPEDVGDEIASAIRALAEPDAAAAGEERKA